MGNILSSYFTKNDYIKVTLDFTNSTPSASVKEVYEKAQKIQESMAHYIKIIMDYKDCNDQIRAAFSDPDNYKILKDAFDVLNPQVQIGCELERLSGELNKTILQMFDVLKICKSDGKTPLLINEQALVYKSVELLSLMLKLDAAKLSKPGLQNDLTFYRRMLPKMKEEDLTLNGLQVNTIISFLADHMPLTSALSKCIASKIAEDGQIESVLGEFGHGLYKIIEAKKFSDCAEENLIFLRAMVVVVIVYDTVKTGGVMAKDSEFNLKMILKFLSENSKTLASDENEIMLLKRQIKYGCKSEKFKLALPSMDIYLKN